MARGRRRYLVAYDIREAKRLRSVHRTMKGHGWAMQYSVFICDLDDIELLGLKAEIDGVINHREDSVAIVDVGNPQDRGVACFDFIGVRPRLPTGGPMVL